MEMQERESRRRATVHDVARAAGVSLATVDRVLNGRPGVRPQTALKVEVAIEALDFRRDLSASLLARAKDLQIEFLLPGGSNEFMASLGEAIEGRAASLRAERTRLHATRFHALDAQVLAGMIEQLDPQQCDCAVVVAIEDEAVRAAIDAASRRGIAMMTLVSDLPGSLRRAFIGIDNVAAGRTAASLLGRFCPQGGKVGLIAGSLGLRDHRERLEGFRDVAAREFPGLEPVGPMEGHDERGETEHLAADLLAAHPDLVGLYNLGAGNAGLVTALQQSGRAGKLRVIAHELTTPTRMGLAEGIIDVVLDQNPDGEIRAAVDTARLLASSGSVADVPPIGIGIFLRDNLG